MGRAVSLRVQLLVLQVAIVLLVVSAAGGVASALQQRQLRDAYLDRMTAVALSVARLPAIIDAFDDDDPAATIQPIAEVIREASDVTYVVVTNDEGVRYSHPEPDRIGEPVSTDPSVPLSGQVWTGTQTGTLGESWRVKVPVFGPDGEVIGTASVGILESELADDLADDLGWLLAALSVAAALGVVCAAFVTRMVRRRIFRLEPGQIAALLETRDAMLHGISEGVVALDREGNVVLVNDEAQRLLGLGATADVVGRPARDVLDPQVLALVPDGTPAPGPGTPGPGIDDGGTLVLAGERVLLARADRARVEGRAVGTVLVLRDHTELHALLRDLDGARGLTDALRAQSHEFANKLHVVSGLLELGRSDEAVAFIERAGHGGLLTASGTAPGVHSPEIAALLLVKATTTRERGALLEVDPGAHLAAPCTPDEDALHGDVLTVLGNLVDNAVEAAGQGGRVRVHVTDGGTDDRSGEGASRSVRVVVEDDGPGIPARARALVFSAGYTTKAGPQGRGIGLALVHRVVARRGGSVRVTASDLGGARVTALLPRPGTSRAVTAARPAAAAPAPGAAR
ncbi:ATP-binding protein [Cellulosimicrobium protaetiae]|uniref:ATP-binding protein n=1 Tax=Cellulosimicrobium protaetiae TaxID=2587808 RepID=UPI001C10A2B9|nr:sensor histidine kinase [Cellulosimicrobium protaetiae]